MSGRNISKQEKLKALKSLLNGTMSFEHLKPPQYYRVWIEDNVYTLDGKKITEEEYNQFLATLRPIDVVFIFRHQPGNEPLIETPAIHFMAQKTNENDEATPSAQMPESISTRTVEELPIDPTPEPEPENVVLVAVPTRSGKLSDYGDTWEIDHKDIFYS